LENTVPLITIIDTSVSHRTLRAKYPRENEKGKNFLNGEITWKVGK